MGEPRTLLYDADGNETDDDALAVRGVTAEVDEHGEVVREIESWQVDKAALQGDLGELSTRPDADD